MPLVDLYATSCQWIPAGEKPWLGLLFFLFASFFNGLVIEIGRKLRRSENEEEGVPTYSKLWGLKTAVWVWFGALIMTALFAIFAAHYINATFLTFISLSSLLIGALILSSQSQWYREKRFEIFSAIWTLTLYLNLGIIPSFA